MGCGSLERDEEEKVSRRNATEEAETSMDEMLAGDVEVECSECGVWCMLEAVGITDARKSEVDGMEVFCMKCMHKQHSKVKAELIACLERVNWLEDTVRGLIGSQNMGRTVSAELRKKPSRKKRAPRRKERKDLSSSTNSNQNGSNNNDEQSFAEVVASTPKIMEEDQDETSSESGGESTINSGVADNEDNNTQAENNNEEGQFKVIRRARKKRCIKIIGDSMVQNINRIVQCNKEGSGCVSKRGAGIKEIVQKATEEASCAEADSLIILQGGGNSLKHIGVKETITSILNGVKKARGERKDLNLAVVSILPRPCENGQYEGWRRAVNLELQKEICKMSMDSTKKKEAGGVSFLDMDCVLHPQLFARDAVHLNREGEARVGKRILTWIKEKERFLLPSDV